MMAVILLAKVIEIWKLKNEKIDILQTFFQQMWLPIPRRRNSSWKSSTFSWTMFARKTIAVNVCWSSIIPRKWSVCWIWTCLIRHCHCSNWCRIAQPRWSTKWEPVRNFTFISNETAGYLWAIEWMVRLIRSRSRIVCCLFISSGLN